MGGNTRLGVGGGQQGQKQMINSRMEHGMKNEQGGGGFSIKAIIYERKHGMWHGTGHC